jgi:hypothetical protein
MPAIQEMHHSASEKQYLLITNVVASNATDAEIIDLQAESWKLPYSIDDGDLTFDGKPLNLLYEENRWMAENPSNHVQYASSRDSYSSSSSSKPKVSFVSDVRLCCYPLLIVLR